MFYEKLMEPLKQVQLPGPGGVQLGGQPLALTLPGQAKAQGIMVPPGGVPTVTLPGFPRPQGVTIPPLMGSMGSSKAGGPVQPFSLSSVSLGGAVVPPKAAPPVGSSGGLAMLEQSLGSKPCAFFWKLGNCKLGSTCPFSHTVAPS